MNLRRLLAYSAVAHSGYALLGITSPEPLGPSSVSFYMLTYGISIVGMFGLLQILDQNGGAGDFKSLEGLRFKSGWMAACLMILILSMAGIPPMVGFLAKFNLFIAALKGSSQPMGLILLVGQGKKCCVLALRNRDVIWTKQLINHENDCQVIIFNQSPVPVFFKPLFLQNITNHPSSTSKEV